MVDRRLEMNMLWEVVEIRYGRNERPIAKFVEHQDAVDFFTRKIKALRPKSVIEYDVKQCKKELKGKRR